jgi:hypothetical protein
LENTLNGKFLVQWEAYTMSENIFSGKDTLKNFEVKAKPYMRQHQLTGGADAGYEFLWLGTLMQAYLPDILFF